MALRVSACAPRAARWPPRFARLSRLHRPGCGRDRRDRFTRRLADRRHHRERARAARRRHRGATRLSSGRCRRTCLSGAKRDLVRDRQLAGDGAHSGRQPAELDRVESGRCRLPAIRPRRSSAAAGFGRRTRPSQRRLRRRRRSRDPRPAWRKARRHDQDRRSGAAIARHDRARARCRRERADPRPACHDRGGCAAGNQTDPAGRAGHLRLPVAICCRGRCRRLGLSGASRLSASGLADPQLS